MEVSGRAGLRVLPLLFLFFLFMPHAAFATSVTLGWDPSPDADLAGYRIYYQANAETLPFGGTGAVEGSAPVDRGNVTMASISGLDPANSYYFAVTAYNSAGEESSYSNVVQIPETLPPLVSVTSPADNATVGGILVVSAAATDNAGIAKVQFLVNGAQVYETATAPYTWNAGSLPKGSYAIAARAVDVSGNEAVSKSVNVAMLGDAISPIVSLAAPPSDVKVGGTINLSASAHDNVGVVKLEISIDGAVILSGNQTPVSYIWDTATIANGSHLVSARAYDAAGNSGVASAMVLVDNTSQAASSSTSTTTSTGSTSSSTVLTLADAQLALQIASGQVAATGDSLQRLDLAPYLNGQPQPNGKIDTGDVVVILSKLTGRL